MKNIQIKEPAAAEIPAPRGEGARAAWILAMGTFAVGTDAFIVSAFLPRMAEGLSVTEAMAGQSVSAFALAYALLAPVIATATSTVARRKLLVWSLALLGAFNLASALCTSLSALILTRIAAAAAAAAYTPNAGAVAAALAHPARRARALSVVIGGLTVATALGVPLGHVVSAVMDWRASLALVGIISLAAAAAVFAVMPAMPGGARIGLRQRLSVLKRPGVMRILPLTVLGMAACYAPYAFTIRILETLRIPAASLTVMLFVYGLGAFAGNYASGRATDRRGPGPVLVCAYGAMAIALGGLAGLAAAGEGSGFYFAAALIACWGASSWAQTPAQQHRLIAAAPQEAPLVIALNASGIYLGISAGTGIGSLAVGQGVPALLGTGSALALASLGYIAMTGAARRKAAASGAPGPG